MRGQLGVSELLSPEYAQMCGGGGYSKLFIMEGCSSKENE